MQAEKDSQGWAAWTQQLDTGVQGDKLNFVRSERVAQVIGDRETIMPPSVRKRWTRSRLVVNEDKSTVPVLHIAASVADPDWEKKKLRPEWKEKNWTFESEENVQFISIGEVGRHRSDIPYSAGSREYWKEYRKRNREKVQSYQKRYNERKRKQIEEAMLTSQAALAEASVNPAFDSALNVRRESLLIDLLGDRKDILEQVDRRDADVGPPVGLSERRKNDE